MKPTPDLLTLAIQFALISLLAVGGANAVAPEVHRQVVELRHWLTDQQFSELYAIAQAAPGPNVMVVALIGEHVAGPLGALGSMLAMCGPTAVLACAVSRLLERPGAARWRGILEEALVPITVGLIAATALIIARAADHNGVAIALTAATFGVMFWTRINPLLALAPAALIGLMGLV